MGSAPGVHRSSKDQSKHLHGDLLRVEWMAPIHDLNAEGLPLAGVPFKEGKQ